MDSPEFIPPIETDLSHCRSAEDVLNSAFLERFIGIFNRHTSETRVGQEKVTKENILNDRNLRYRMRGFFRDQVQIRLTGAQHAETIVNMSKIVNDAMKILDERNQKLKGQEFSAGDDNDLLFLKKSFTTAA